MCPVTKILYWSIRWSGLRRLAEGEGRRGRQVQRQPFRRAARGGFWSGAAWNSDSDFLPSRGGDECPAQRKLLKSPEFAPMFVSGEVWMADRTELLEAALGIFPEGVGLLDKEGRIVFLESGRRGHYRLCGRWTCCRAPSPNRWSRCCWPAPSRQIRRVAKERNRVTAPWFASSTSWAIRFR